MIFFKKIFCKPEGRINAYKKDFLKYQKPKQAVVGDLMFTVEWGFRKKFPWYGRDLVRYKLIGEYWIETDRSHVHE